MGFVLIDLPTWLIAAGTIIPVLTGAVSWLLASRKHIAEAARVAGAREGESKARADQQHEATKRVFDHLERQKERIERLERIVQQQREVLIREGFMVPTDTQTGVRNPLLPR